MNKIRLAILWLVGLAISYLFSSTGLRLLDHAAKTKETWENGYPITVLAGTAWGYVVPIIIIGVLLMVTSKKLEKKGKKG